MRRGLVAIGLGDISGDEARHGRRREQAHRRLSDPRSLGEEVGENLGAACPCRWRLAEAGQRAGGHLARDLEYDVSC